MRLCDVASLAAAAATPVPNSHSSSQPYIADPPNVIGRGRHVDFV